MPPRLSYSRAPEPDERRKSLEQKSFWLTEDEYMQQLDAVCFFLNQWGVSERCVLEDV